jgi:proteasome lid subunit RPN8/RPN11
MKEVVTGKLPPKGIEVPEDVTGKDGNLLKKDEVFRISRATREKLVRICFECLPNKTFGFLSGSEQDDLIDEVHVMTRNLKDQCVALFRQIGGAYYVDGDHGFVIDPREMLPLIKEQRELRRDLKVVFHIHRYQDSTPTHLDVAMGPVDMVNLVISFVKDEIEDIDNLNFTAYKIVQDGDGHKYYNPMKIEEVA